MTGTKKTNKNPNRTTPEAIRRNFTFKREQVTDAVGYTPTHENGLAILGNFRRFSLRSLLVWTSYEGLPPLLNRAKSVLTVKRNHKTTIPHEHNNPNLSQSERWRTIQMPDRQQRNWTHALVTAVEFAGCDSTKRDYWCEDKERYSHGNPND